VAAAKVPTAAQAAAAAAAAAAAHAAQQGAAAAMQRQAAAARAAAAAKSVVMPVRAMVTPPAAPRPAPIARLSLDLVARTMQPQVIRHMIAVPKGVSV
jgi:hypothetical protein